jgi:hypothetical protein
VLSDVQFSRYAETEVAKLLTFGRPRGVLEVMVPIDRWRPYACDPSEIAGRVVKFLQAHEGAGVRLCRESQGRPSISRGPSWSPGRPEGSVTELIRTLA